MKNLVISMLLVLWSFPVVAASLPPASLAELVSAGIEQNLNLKVDQLAIPLAVADSHVNEAVFDPELFSSAGYSAYSVPIDSFFSPVDKNDAETLSGEVGLRKRFTSGLSASLALATEWSENNDTTINLDPTYATSVDLSLSQPLLKNFGAEINTTELRISKNTVKQADLSYLSQAQAIALEVTLLSCKYAGETIVADLRSEAVQLADELLAANRRRQEIGVVPISEVQEAETALADRELNLSLAKQAREESFEQLNRLLNHSLTTEFDARSFFPFADPFKPEELDTFTALFAEAKEKNPALQIADIAIENSAMQKRYFHNQLKPRLDLIMNFSASGLAGENRTASVSSRYAGSWADSVVSAAEREGSQWGAALEFSIPLGNRAAKAKLRKAHLNQRQARFVELDIESELKTNLLTYHNNLQRAKQQVFLAERFEDLAQTSLRQEQRRLEEGLSDTFRLLSFQDKMITAKIGRVNALAQYHQAAALLDYARGIILENLNLSVQQGAEEKTIDFM